MRKRVAKIFRDSVLYISKCLTGFRRKIPKMELGKAFIKQQRVCLQ